MLSNMLSSKKQEKLLSQDYFSRLFFPARALYICGDIECDVVFAVEDERITRCPRCGSANTAPLISVLSSRSAESWSDYVRYLRVCKARRAPQQTALPFERR